MEKISAFLPTKATVVTLVGDVGARHLIYENMGRVLEVPMSTPGIIFDVDRPSDLSELRSLKS
jgi:CTP:molybdopterin cytidylyltransferase MocA